MADIAFSRGGPMLWHPLFIGVLASLGVFCLLQSYAAARAGRWEEARNLQSEVNELIRILIQYPVFPPPGCRCAGRASSAANALRRAADQE